MAPFGIWKGPTSFAEKRRKRAAVEHHLGPRRTAATAFRWARCMSMQTTAFIADLLDAEIGEGRHDYLDFCMGTVGVHDRADLTPVYAMICRRLARLNCDRMYVFPRISVIEFDRDDGTMDLAERM